MRTKSFIKFAKRRFTAMRENQHRKRKSLVASWLPILVLAIYGMVEAQSLMWEAQGPGPNTQGQVENITDREVVGAINAVAPHPTNANIVYVGAVNGCIWRTDNAMVASPTWEQHN